jgi:predicted CopG family antitoxin
MKRHLSLTVEADVYREVKKIIPEGQISTFVNNLLKEQLKKKKQEQLIASYKKTAKSKAVKEEDKIWEGSIEDGIENE